MKNSIKIKVISFGGAGTNMINRIIETTDNKNIDYMSISTSREELNFSNANSKLLIGEKVTKGLGTYCNVELGIEAFKESEKEIKDYLQKELKNVNVVFLVSSLGGGTGAGVTPSVSEIINKMGIVTIGVVSLPFIFEGQKKNEISKKGQKELSKNVDLLLISNSNNLFLKEVKDLFQSFKDLDDSVRQDVQEVANSLFSYDFEYLSYDNLKKFVQNNIV